MDRMHRSAVHTGTRCGAGIVAILLWALLPALARAQSDPDLFRRRFEARARILSRDPSWPRLAPRDLIPAFLVTQSPARWDDSTAIAFMTMIGRSNARADSQTCMQILETGSARFEVLFSVDSVTAEGWVEWFALRVRRGLASGRLPVATFRQVDSVITLVDQRVRARSPGIDMQPPHRACGLQAQFVEELLALPEDLASAVIRATALAGVQDHAAERPIDTAAVWLDSSGTAVLREAVVETRPTVIQCPPVTYPQKLRKAGVHGRVVFQLIVDTLGHPEPRSVQVIESPHDSLTVAAHHAVLGCDFTPARVHGRAVRVLIQLPFVFHASAP